MKAAAPSQRFGDDAFRHRDTLPRGLVDQPVRRDQQRERAVNEYKLAQRTKDNTQGALEEAQKYITAKYERARNTN